MPPSYDVAIDEPGKGRRIVPMTVTHADRDEARRIAASLNEVPLAWVKLAEQVIHAPTPKTRRRSA